MGDWADEKALVTAREASGEALSDEDLIDGGIVAVIAVSLREAHARGYREGQERMRERADFVASSFEPDGLGPCEALDDVARTLRTLPTEEPTHDR